MRFTIKFSWSISYTPTAYSTTNYLILNHFIDKFKSYLSMNGEQGSCDDGE